MTSVQMIMHYEFIIQAASWCVWCPVGWYLTGMQNFSWFVVDLQIEVP